MGTAAAHAAVLRLITSPSALSNARFQRPSPPMLVKFSTGYGQLLMQGEPAIALVKLGGHSGTVPSAVLAADLAPFAAKLRAGLELHGDTLSPAPPAADASRGEDDDDEPRERPIQLRLRAVPLLDMIETALRQKSDLVWEKN